MEEKFLLARNYPRQARKEKKRKQDLDRDLKSGMTQQRRRRAVLAPANTREARKTQASLTFRWCLKEVTTFSKGLPLADGGWIGGCCYLTRIISQSLDL